MNHEPLTPEVKARAYAHVNRFLASKVGARTLAAAGWTNNPLKELSESLAIVRMAMQLRDRSKPLTCLVVGDGTTPRTGHMVANLTAWHVTSVDPMMRPSHAKQVGRVLGVRGRCRDVAPNQYDVVLAPHSHAPPARTRARRKRSGVLVAMPCCVPWHDTTGQVYTCDCLSPARTLIVEAP